MQKYFLFGAGDALKLHYFFMGLSAMVHVVKYVKR